MKGGSDRRRTVVWLRLMLMHAAAKRSSDSVADVNAQGFEREVPEPMAGRDSARIS